MEWTPRDREKNEKLVVAHGARILNLEYSGAFGHSAFCA